MHVTSRCAHVQRAAQCPRSAAPPCYTHTYHSPYYDHMRAGAAAQSGDPEHLVLADVVLVLLASTADRRLLFLSC